MRHRHAMPCVCWRPGPESPPFFSPSPSGFFSNQCNYAGWPALCHNMKAVLPFQIFAAMLIFLPPRCAEGPSLGIVRLRDTQGPFIITIFTSPELVSGRTADVSVLVQE